MINENCSEIDFYAPTGSELSDDITDIPCVIVTDSMEEPELIKYLKCRGVKGLSGRYISQPEYEISVNLRNVCEDEEIQMTSFESIMEFSQFKLNENGLIPVIVQHYQTAEVLMLAYMNEEAFIPYGQDRTHDLLQQKPTEAVAER